MIEEHEYYDYHIIDNTHVRFTMDNESPVMAEIIDMENKNLKIDNLFIIRKIETLEKTQSNEKEFISECKKYGINLFSLYHIK